jgi:hypothetical protein
VKADQPFVMNIFTAKPEDYRKAMQRVCPSKERPPGIRLIVLS